MSRSSPALPFAGVASGPARLHSIVYIEQATLDPDGLLSVSGWALAMGPILALQVYADEARVGNARQGDVRTDVAAAHPGFPNGRQSGFSLVCSLDSRDLGAVFVRVQAVCPNGFGAGRCRTDPAHRAAWAADGSGPGATLGSAAGLAAS